MWADFRAVSMFQSKSSSGEHQHAGPLPPLPVCSSEGHYLPHGRPNSSNARTPGRKVGNGGLSSWAHSQVPWPLSLPPAAGFVFTGMGELRQWAILLAFRSPPSSPGEAQGTCSVAQGQFQDHVSHREDWPSLKASSLPAGGDIVCQGF